MRVHSALLAACLLLAPQHVPAQKSPVEVSVEVYVAQAEQVFVGRITSVGDTSGTGSAATTPIGIDVDRTFKGRPGQHLSMDFVPNWYRWEFHPRYISSPTDLPRSRRILFCVAPMSNGHAKVTAFDLDNPGLEGLSNSLAVLRDPEAVLNAAAAAARRFPTAATNLKTTFVGAGSQESLKGTQFWGADIYIVAADGPAR